MVNRTFSRVELLKDAKPILFNTAMVKAILAGHKCCTRRLCTPQPVFRNGETGVYELMDDGSFLLKVDGYKGIYDYPAYPKYFVGDVLYVRETWAEDKNNYFYKADFSDDDLQKIANITRWRPSIHMPKVAARIFLRVTNVRLEPLQSITEEDAVKEGVSRLFDHLSDEYYSDWAKRTHSPLDKTSWGWKNYLWHGHFGSCGTGNALSDAWVFQESAYDSPVDSFSSLWNSTIPLSDWGKHGWEANPWVWVYEFEIVS